jgi:predicted Kef-type K+ transport protein
MVGLLLFGVLLGPHVLGFFGEQQPIADFFAELGKLLLMFSAGLVQQAWVNPANAVPLTLSHPLLFSRQNSVRSKCFT